MTTTRTIVTTPADIAEGERAFDDAHYLAPLRRVIVSLTSRAMMDDHHAERFARDLAPRVLKMIRISIEAHDQLRDSPQSGCKSCRELR